MYSMVLLTALSVGASTPASCHGCYGCQGYSACYGCHGYVASGCYGCQGYGHGCSGLFSCFKRHGCYGCAGYGCHGGSYGCHGCYGCYGCYGCSGSMAAPAGLPPAGAPAGAPAPRPAAPPAGGAPKVEGKEEVSAPAPARLLVSVPADAKLMIDNVATKSTSATRLFVTPDLNPGKDYFYTLSVEITRNGKTETVSKQVTVRAGQTTETSLDLPVATAAK